MTSENPYRSTVEVTVGLGVAYRVLEGSLNLPR